MTIVIIMELSMSSAPPIHWNKTELWKERIELSSPLQGQCLMSTKYRKGFGPKQSTSLAMHQIGSICTACSRRPPMSYWLEESQMCHTFRSLVASAISTRRDNTLESFKI